MLGLIYYSWKNLSKILRGLEKSTKQLLKLYHLLKKKDFGEDTYIYGTTMQFLRKK